MTRGPVLVGFVLAVLAAVHATRVAAHFPALALEPVRDPAVRVQAPLRRFLEALDEPLFLTYYVTGRADMPSSMRDVEPAVLTLLRRMAAVRPDRVRFQVVDPGQRADLGGFAARRRAAPFRRREIRHDAVHETTVWSTLTLALGARQDAAIHAIQPRHLPHLQRLILEHLRQLDDPKRPVIALAAPPGYRQLELRLAEHGEVRRVDLNNGAPFPDDADCLFWMEPTEPAARSRELDAYLETGHAVVLAAATTTARVTTGRDARARVEFRRAGAEGTAMLEEFGLVAGDRLVLDARHGTWPVAGHAEDPAGPAAPGTAVEAPFVVRCIAPNQDFHGFADQPNGHLYFVAPRALHLNTTRLASRGLTAEVHATTSDHTWLRPWPDAPVAVESLQPAQDTAAAKQPLVVSLTRPGDPWRGPLVVTAGATPFQDAWLEREGNAHWRLVRVLAQTLASPDRQVIARAAVGRRQALPPMTAPERWGWRALCLLVGPVVLLGLLARRRHRLPLAHSAPVRFSWRVAGGLAVVVLLVLASNNLPVSLDLTEEGLHRLAPESRAIAGSLPDSPAIEAAWVVSADERLPPVLRPEVDRVPALLHDLAETGAALEVHIVHPEDLDPDPHARRKADGVLPLQSTSDEDGVVTRREYHATLLLRHGPRTERLVFPDQRSFEDLQFRVAFALWRLQTGHTPHIAFASDSPRPSAAEAYEQYQMKGLLPPKGTDVYEVARRTLTDAGFRVTHVNPRAPEMPADVDALVWLQPRRSTADMLAATLRYLHGGGRVFLAVQHFNLQAHQYRGAGFEVVYWPEPQVPDVEHLYFPGLGVELMREVLFDRLHEQRTQDVRIHGRGAGRVFERQATAMPALIRGSSAHAAKGSAVTQGLGDQSFLWASRLHLDRERLRTLGIEATTLWTTSARAWSFAWQAGWIPDELLAGPAPELKGGGDWLGQVPLMVMFEGIFPLPGGPLILPMFEAPDPLPPDPFADLRDRPGSPGRLLFLGCSEVFKNDVLVGLDRRGDQLLVNAVAELALPEDLAMLAGRRAVARGLDYVSPAARLWWRLGVLVTIPFGLGLFRLGWQLLRCPRRGGVT